MINIIYIPGKMFSFLINEIDTSQRSSKVTKLFLKIIEVNLYHICNDTYIDVGGEE